VFVIYKATNVINGKSYIGQAMDFIRRQVVHKRDAENGCHNVFHRAIRKYGWDAFEWTILFEDDDEDQAWMDWWETRMIAKHGTLLPNGYNMTAGGKGIPRLVHTEETKRKMSESAKGIPCSEETKRKLSAFFTGRKRGPVSEETRKNMSLAHTGKRCTEETKAKLSSLYQGKTLEEIYGDEKASGIRAKLKLRKPSRTGILHTDETKEKISSSRKGKGTGPRSEEAVKNMTAARQYRACEERLYKFLFNGRKLDLTSVFSGD